MNRPELIASYWISIKISAASAVGGAIVGFFIAHAVVSGVLPPWLRPAAFGRTRPGSTAIEPCRTASSAWSD